MQNNLTMLPKKPVIPVGAQLVAKVAAGGAKVTNSESKERKSPSADKVNVTTKKAVNVDEVSTTETGAAVTSGLNATSDSSKTGLLSTDSGIGNVFVPESVSLTGQENKSESQKLENSAASLELPDSSDFCGLTEGDSMLQEATASLVLYIEMYKKALLEKNNSLKSRLHDPLNEAVIATDEKMAARVVVLIKEIARIKQTIALLEKAELPEAESMSLISHCDKKAKRQQTRKCLLLICLLLSAMLVLIKLWKRF